MEHPLGSPQTRAQNKPNKFKSLKIISSIFSDYNGMKPEIKKKKQGKNNYMEIKQHTTKKKKNGSMMKSKKKF